MEFCRMIGEVVTEGHVDRPRLTGLAGLLAHRRLALVHAPAGCGKTTLLSQWRAALLRTGVRVAWVSIGSDEQDPISLAAHLVPVIQTACGLSAGTRPVYPVEEAVVALCALIDEACRSGPLAVMIDDYHLAQQPAARQLIATLLAGRPPGLVLVIASRGRPDLSLGRLRANDGLIEIDHDALRFSDPEMERFFASSDGLPLTAAQIRFVQQRTEGWAAGLRLMSLALRRSAERDAILAGTPGSRRDFADYFLEEVLDRLDTRLIRFLLLCSPLEELHAELCAAVTGEAEAGRLLDELERCHLFTTALHGRPGWYRFHHLFLEFLRARAASEPDLDLLERHRRAAEWFVQADSPMEAVRHAFLSRDPARAAELIERSCVFDYLSFGRFDVYHRWMRQIPEAILAARPLLSFLLAWRHINGRRFAQAEQVLSGIQATCLDREGAPTVAVQATGLQVKGRLHLMRALIGAYGADLRACRHHVEAASLRPLDDFAFGQVDLDSIHSYLALQRGHLDTAQRLTWKAYRRYRELDCHWGAMHSQCIAAMASMAAGELREAGAILAEAVETGAAHFPQTSYPVALPRGLLGALRYEEGDFAEAERLLLQAAAGDLHASMFGLPERVIVPTVALARLYDATGRAEEADALLVRASRLAYQAEDIRLDFQLAVERADRAFRLGRAGDAVAETARLEAQVEAMRQRFDDDAWSIWQPYAILDARRLAQAGQGKIAIGRLQALGARAVAAGRHAHNVAIQAIAGALMAAEDAGAAAALIEDSPARARQFGLLHALNDVGLGPASPAFTASSPPHKPAAALRMVDADRLGLTLREHAVLICLGDGLSNGEISRRLAINVNTVKTHLKSIFSKLDVRSRTQAVLLVQDLRASHDVT